MSDTALNKIIQYGTAAERVAFTPDPASGSQVLYIWYETDNAPDTYVWDGSAWVQINPATVGGITQLTGDITAGPGSGSQAAAIVNNAVVTAKILNSNVTYAKIQNISATSRILGRKTSGAGDTEECTLSQILDFIGSAAQGDILYRGASSWSKLAAGTSGQFLKTQGAGADPVWDTPTGTSTISLATVTLTDAQIKLLQSVPITVIAAPGAGKTLFVVGMYVMQDTTAGAYSASVTANLRYVGIGQNITTGTNTYAFSSAVFRQYEDYPQSRAFTVDVTNKGIEFLSNSDLTGGNAANTVKLYILYTTLTN